jgi:hypothetical protein
MKFFLDFVKEIWAFLKVRKKLWLAPLIFLMVAVGGILIISQGSVIAPLIYTIF